MYIYISHVYSWSRVFRVPTPPQGEGDSTMADPWPWPRGRGGLERWTIHTILGGPWTRDTGPYIIYIYIYVYKRVRVRMQSTGQVRKLFFIALGFVALTASPWLPLMKTVLGAWNPTGKHQTKWLTYGSQRFTQDFAALWPFARLEAFEWSRSAKDGFHCFSWFSTAHAQCATGRWTGHDWVN